MQTSSLYDLSIIMPAYNEGDYLTETVEDIILHLPKDISWQFIISEDGSIDNTKETILDLSKKYSILPLISDLRKGYALAVVDAINASNSEYILFLDSDRQLDPKDINLFWEKREQADYVVGNRVKRADSKARIIASKLFMFYYNYLFRNKLQDPSCPMILISSAKCKLIARDWFSLGVRISEGFWWEFNAWAFKRNFKYIELPIRHYLRADGTGTKVYNLKKLPDILFRNIKNIYMVKISDLND